MPSYENNASIFDNLPRPQQKRWIKNLVIIPVMTVNVIVGLVGFFYFISSLYAELKFAKSFGTYLTFPDLAVILAPIVLIYGISAKGLKGWLCNVGIYYFIISCLFSALGYESQMEKVFTTYITAMMAFSIPLILLHSRALKTFYQVEDLRMLWLKGLLVALPLFAVALLLGEHNYI